MQGQVRKGRFLVWDTIKVFASAWANRRVFRFHVNQLDDLEDHLKRCGYKTENILVTHHEPKPGIAVKLKMLAKWSPLDYQVPIIEFAKRAVRTVVIPLQTGRGKTFIALKVAEELGVRTALSIKGMYVDKWVGDVKEAYNLKSSEVAVLRGSKQLKGAIYLAKQGRFKAKFVIFTNTTLYNFLEHYEETCGDVEEYGCAPQDLMQLLGIGLLIRDEVHQDFHLNFRLDLYAHVPKILMLSATLNPDNKFLVEMYKLMMPLSTRYTGATYVRYIAVTALTYRFKQMQHVRYTNLARRSYSHVIFEQSIMKHRYLLEGYMEKIRYGVKHIYMDRREQGQRMLIFCATIELCSYVSEKLQVMFPEIKVARYVGEDPMSNIMTADLTVTTVKSAGTALDVPDLRFTWLTDNLNSSQIVEQVLGRLRQMKGKWAGITPEFYYSVCLQIPKHLEYHNNKLTLFADKALTHNERQLGVTV
jgi:superfamily II DNA or RNA helicase